jgi:hypothetical protein
MYSHGFHIAVSMLLLLNLGCSQREEQDKESLMHAIQGTWCATNASGFETNIQSCIISGDVVRISTTSYWGSVFSNPVVHLVQEGRLVMGARASPLAKRKAYNIRVKPLKWRLTPLILSVAEEFSSGAMWGWVKWDVGRGVERTTFDGTDDGSVVIAVDEEAVPNKLLMDSSAMLDGQVGTPGENVVIWTRLEGARSRQSTNEMSR